MFIFSTLLLVVTFLLIPNWVFKNSYLKFIIFIFVIMVKTLYKSYSNESTSTVKDQMFKHSGMDADELKQHINEISSIKL